jgi:hypothetical protein
LLTLHSRIPAKESFFLSSQRLNVEGKALPEENLLRELSASVAAGPNFADIITRRRKVTSLQQIFIGVAAFLLVIFVPLALF